jgi:hypothetical protein
MRISKEYWTGNTGKDKKLGINGGLVGKDEASVTNMNTISVPSVDEFARNRE